VSIKPENKPHIFLSIAIAATVYIFFSGPLFINNIPILLTQIFGVLLVLWAILSINLNKHHGQLHKLPNGIFLVTQGPYEIIRHPIYAGILLFISGYVQGHPSLLRYVVFTVLFVVLLLKLLYEEEVVEKDIKEYASYKKKTHRLIPYLY
jgi:protein-S-isoprenylcysteine O-methyltransferase Ste14